MHCLAECGDANCDIYVCADQTQTYPDCDKFVLDDTQLGNNCVGAKCSLCLPGYVVDPATGICHSKFNILQINFVSLHCYLAYCSRPFIYVCCNVAACDAHCDDDTLPTATNCGISGTTATCSACVEGYYVTATFTCARRLTLSFVANWVFVFVVL